MRLAFLRWTLSLGMVVSGGTAAIAQAPGSTQNPPQSPAQNGASSSPVATEAQAPPASPGEKGWGAEKASSLDFTAVLMAPASVEPNELRCTRKQPDLLAKAIDKSVIARVAATLQRRGPSEARVVITNADRAFGALLAGGRKMRQAGWAAGWYVWA